MILTPEEQDRADLEARANLKISCVELANAQIFMMISFGLNTFLALLTAGTEKASDKEWFRIRTYNYVVIFFQMIFGTTNLLSMVA